MLAHIAPPVLLASAMLGTALCWETAPNQTIWGTSQRFTRRAIGAQCAQPRKLEITLRLLRWLDRAVRERFHRGVVDASILPLASA